LNVPVGTVMSRLSRGKAELRKALSDQQSEADRRIIEISSFQNEGTAKRGESE
jgi:hypothetical protein